MSDRIDELVREAIRFELDPDSNAYEAQIDPDDAGYLVELVIEECIKVCLEQRDPGNLNYKPSVKTAEAIKRHFGLE